MITRKVKPLFCCLLVGLVIAVFVSLTLGSIKIELGEILKAFLNKIGIGSYDIEPMYSLIIFKVRLPRIILGALAGMGLSLVGAVYQGFFRNPMADPYMLGMSSGAALGATIAIILGLDVFFFGLGIVPLFAFIGAVGTSIIVYLIATTGFRRQKVTLLLSGIAISYFFSSIISLLMVFNRKSIDKIVFWTLGGLSGADWSQIFLLLPVLILAGGGLLLFARDLNILALGDDSARSLGVDVDRMNLPVMALSSLIVAVCVSFTGVIGFVGLIVPHIIRIISGPDHRSLLPLSILGGGLFLVLADTIARTAAAPAEIPVGAITALIGSPYFIWLLLKGRKEGTI